MSEVAIRVLGCGDAFGSGGRLQTCFYVTDGATNFLIDCGASALVGMKRYGVDPAGIEYILLTHLHGDHFAGVPFLEREAQIVAGRTKALVIAGPKGAEKRVREAQEVLFPGSTKKEAKFPLGFIELPDEWETNVGPLKVTAYPGVHTKGTEAHALRVEFAGKVIAYSGDTEWTEGLVKAAAGADVFICEGYRWEPVRNHLDYRTLMEHREELRCKRIVLTHLSEEMLGRLGEMELEVAEDGKKMVV